MHTLESNVAPNSFQPGSAPNDAYTILVVDGRESLCEVIEVCLSRVGYHVLTATTAAQALKLAHATR